MTRKKYTLVLVDRSIVVSVYLRPQRRAKRSYGAIVLAILCVVLLLFGAAIQIGHAHPDGTIHSTCSLCATAHTVLSVVALPALMLLLECVSPLLTERTRPVQGFTLPFALFTRPPPDPAAVS